MELAASCAIVVTVLALGLTYGRRGALRAERHAGAWAWIAYAGLGSGMVFGALSVDYPMLVAFMWTKIAVLVATGAWLVGRRIRRRERLFPGRKLASAAG